VFCVSSRPLLFVEHLAEIFRLSSGWLSDEDHSLRPRCDRDRRGHLLLPRHLYARGGLYSRRDMAVASFISHFPRSFFPAVNGGDAAVLFCFVLFYIFFAGGGTWSLDRVVLKQED
jgi:hypothetical protein